MRQYVVMLAQFPGGNQTHAEAAGWVTATALKMAKDPRISKVIPFRIGDTPITMGRNRAVKVALENGVDYILMVDSDMKPDLPYAGAKPFWDSSWEWMLKRRDEEEAIREKSSDEGCAEAYLTKWYAPATVAAPYCGPPPEECVYVFQWAGFETGSKNPNFKLDMIPRETAALRVGLESVPALPTGVILYDIRVFRRMEAEGLLPWFEYEWKDKPYNTEKATTEDVYQTRNAGMLGCPQIVNWDAWAGHIKSKIVPKPEILTQDHVMRELHKGIASGVQGNQKVKIGLENPPPYQAAPQPCQSSPLERAESQAQADSPSELLRRAHAIFDPLHPFGALVSTGPQVQLTRSQRGESRP